MVEDTPELMASVSKAKATPTGAAPKGSKAACNSVFETMLLARQEYLRTEDAQFELSVKDVAQAGIGLIIAGNDTSGLGITGLLGMLPMFPEVMQKVRQEQELVSAGQGAGQSMAARAYQQQGRPGLAQACAHVFRSIALDCLQASANSTAVPQPA
jgi:cytochrome P450